MCGIAGLINAEGRYPADALREMALAMRQSLSHRGPDDVGLWQSNDGMACFAHTRLAVLDPRPEGRQPMLRGDVALTFNGEIYNCQEIRRERERLGDRFQTRTDTEVLCYLLQEDPAEAIAKIRGMYAFGAWISSKRELILARDPMGEKPLYYTFANGLFAFASELTALEVLPEIRRDIDPVAIQEYLLLQYVPAPRTIYRQCMKLSPGSLARIRFTEPGRAPVSISRPAGFTSTPAQTYDSCKINRGVPTEPSPQRVDELRKILIETVREQWVSDVPIGAFLSGGVDSSLIVSILAKELKVGVRTFSLGFADSPESEHATAREIARRLNTEHHELVIPANAVDLLPKIAQALDEPNGDSSCLPVYLLSQFARRSVTVALSGDGGDELFGGYRRYADTLLEASDPWRHVKSLRRRRRLWNLPDAYIGYRFLNVPQATAARLTGGLLPEVVDGLDQWRRLLQTSSWPVIHRLRALDLQTYLPGSVLAKVDRMAMRFGLEVRAPLLDKRVVAFAQSLTERECFDGARTKPLLRTLAARYLPREIVALPKTGFGLPERLWAKGALFDQAHELLLAPSARIGGHLDAKELRGFLEDQRRPDRFSVYQIWSLLILENWLRNRRSAGAVRMAA